MLYRTMGKTGDKISVLGFGAMRVPQKLGRIDEAEATRQIRFAIDQGVNYIDTAMLYHMGANEPFLGRALADGYREKVNLATKPLLSALKTREDIDRVLNAQLEMLRTDHIDYYLFHGLNRQYWNRLRDLGGREFMDILAGIDDLVPYLEPPVDDLIAADFALSIHAKVDEIVERGQGSWIGSVEKDLEEV